MEGECRLQHDWGEEVEEEGGRGELDVELEVGQIDQSAD